MLEFHALGFLLLLPPRHPGHGDDDGRPTTTSRKEGNIQETLIPYHIK